MTSEEENPASPEIERYLGDAQHILELTGGFDLSDPLSGTDDEKKEELYRRLGLSSFVSEDNRACRALISTLEQQKLRKTEKGAEKVLLVAAVPKQGSAFRVMVFLRACIYRIIADHLDPKAEELKKMSEKDVPAVIDQRHQWILETTRNKLLENFYIDPEEELKQRFQT